MGASPITQAHPPCAFSSGNLRVVPPDLEPNFGWESREVTNGNVDLHGETVGVDVESCVDTEQEHLRPDTTPHGTPSPDPKEPSSWMDKSST
jgi:hypothetical protein